MWNMMFGNLLWSFGVEVFPWNMERYVLIGLMADAHQARFRTSSREKTQHDPMLEYRGLQQWACRAFTNRTRV